MSELVISSSIFSPAIAGSNPTATSMDSIHSSIEKSVASMKEQLGFIGDMDQFLKETPISKLYKVSELFKEINKEQNGEKLHDRLLNELLKEKEPELNRNQRREKIRQGFDISQENLKEIAIYEELFNKPKLLKQALEEKAFKVPENLKEDIEKACNELIRKQSPTNVDMHVGSIVKSIYELKQNELILASIKKQELSTIEWQFRSAILNKRFEMEEYGEYTSLIHKIIKNELINIFYCISDYRGKMGPVFLEGPEAIRKTIELIREGSSSNSLEPSNHAYYYKNKYSEEALLMYEKQLQEYKTKVAKEEFKKFKNEPNTELSLLERELILTSFKECPYLTKEMKGDAGFILYLYGGEMSQLVLEKEEKIAQIILNKDKIPTKYVDIMMESMESLTSKYSEEEFTKLLIEFNNSLPERGQKYFQEKLEKKKFWGSIFKIFIGACIGGGIFAGGKFGSNEYKKNKIEKEAKATLKWLEEEEERRKQEKKDRESKKIDMQWEKDEESEKDDIDFMTQLHSLMVTNSLNADEKALLREAKEKPKERKEKLKKLKTQLIEKEKFIPKEKKPVKPKQEVEIFFHNKVAQGNLHQNDIKALLEKRQAGNTGDGLKRLTGNENSKKKLYLYEIKTHRIKEGDKRVIVVGDAPSLDQVTKMYVASYSEKHTDIKNDCETALQRMNNLDKFTKYQGVGKEAEEEIKIEKSREEKVPYSEQSRKKIETAVEQETKKSK